MERSVVRGPRGSGRLWLGLRRAAAGVPSLCRWANTSLWEAEMLPEPSLLFKQLPQNVR
jgi:hypothetical protein